MTPREIAGCLYFAHRRMAREAAQSLVLNTMAARGDPNKVKQQIAKLQDV